MCRILDLLLLSHQILLIFSVVQTFRHMKKKVTPYFIQYFITTTTTELKEKNNIEKNRSYFDLRQTSFYGQKYKHTIKYNQLIQFLIKYFVNLPAKKDHIQILKKKNALNLCSCAN